MTPFSVTDSAGNVHTITGGSLTITTGQNEQTGPPTTPGDEKVPPAPVEGQEDDNRPPAAPQPISAFSVTNDAGDVTTIPGETVTITTPDEPPPEPEPEPEPEPAPADEPF
jgi:hypothetical protein